MSILKRCAISFQIFFTQTRIVEILTEIGRLVNETLEIEYKMIKSLKAVARQKPSEKLRRATQNHVLVRNLKSFYEEGIFILSNL
jgi:hypothetical protein